MYLNDGGRRASCLDGTKLRLNAKGRGHAGTLEAWPHSTREKLRGCASQCVEGPFLGAWRTPSQSAVLSGHDEGTSALPEGAGDMPSRSPGRPSHYASQGCGR